jgi:hypothetical protein
MKGCKKGRERMKFSKKLGMRKRSDRNGDTTLIKLKEMFVRKRMEKKI